MVAPGDIYIKQEMRCKIFYSYKFLTARFDSSITSIITMLMSVTLVMYINTLSTITLKHFTFMMIITIKAWIDKKYSIGFVWTVGIKKIIVMYIIHQILLECFQNQSRTRIIVRHFSVGALEVWDWALNIYWLRTYWLAFKRLKKCMCNKVISLSRNI